MVHSNAKSMAKFFKAHMEGPDAKHHTERVPLNDEVLIACPLYATAYAVNLENSKVQDKVMKENIAHCVEFSTPKKTKATHHSASYALASIIKIERAPHNHAVQNVLSTANTKTTSIRESPMFERVSKIFSRPVLKRQCSNSQKDHMCKEINFPNTLEEVVKSQEHRIRFHNFLKKEFSDENLDFWIECENYKSLSPSKQEKEANKIYDEYIQPNALRQINIDGCTRELISKTIAPPSRDVFNEAQRQVFQLMKSDSFPRFMTSLKENMCT